MTYTLAYSRFCALGFCCFMALNAAAQGFNIAPPAPAVPDTGFHAILLGTGIPIPNPDRATAATLIVAGGKRVLVDTGFNALLRLTQAGYQDVDLVLYTHFHSDHFGGLFQFLFNRGAAGADSPLEVIGPAGTKSVVDLLVAANAIDEKYRIAHHGEHWPAAAMKVHVTESKPGVIFDVDGLRITMFDVDHEPVEPAVGYRFDYAGKSIVVSGDTRKSNNLIAAAQGCDLLIHEAMNAQMLNAVLPVLRNRNARQAAMLEDLMEHHTSTLEVAEVAKAAGVKKLVLTHLVPSIPPADGPEQNFRRGMEDIYSGPIVLGRDGMAFTVAE